MTNYISMIPYANLAPVRSLGCPAGFSFIYLTPRQSADALAAGRTVAAPVPTAALPDLGDKLEFLGNYGIAAGSEVGSVLLYSRKPFAALNRHCSVYLTGQSATSVLMLYLLLRENNSPANLPQPVSDRRRADAVLLIGDDAMIHAEKGQYPYCHDLASLWYRQFHRPMVFARWVVRKDAPRNVKKALLNWLSRLNREDARLITKSAALEAYRLDVSVGAMAAYLRGMRRVLTAADLAGQEFFLARARAEYPAYRRWNRTSNATAAASDRPRAHNHGRISPARCLDMLRKWPLGELMALAHAERMRKHPGRLVTFVQDTNPNYTNICHAKCTFCAFHRNAKDPDSYTLSPAELAAKVRAAALKGATTVLLQGGLNRTISLALLVSYIREIRKTCPALHIHPFSPPEIDAVARNENRSAGYVLNTLWNEGIHTMPGGGAEILANRVRRLASPRKCSATRWLEIMETAHRIGFRTTATMMYGHLENEQEITWHLSKLRLLQDRTGGFSSFIAWSFKPGNSPLGRTIQQPAHPALYLRLIAVARLFLDNFDHVQSSWFSESENAGCLGLLGGADDFGGILVEENVLRTAGHARQTTADNVRRLIRESGFIPARRDSDYRVLEVFDK